MKVKITGNVHNEHGAIKLGKVINVDEKEQQRLIRLGVAEAVAEPSEPKPPTLAALRKQAKALGIEGAAEMDAGQLMAAIEQAEDDGEPDGPAE